MANAEMAVAQAIGSLFDRINELLIRVVQLEKDKHADRARLDAIERDLPRVTKSAGE